MRLSRLVSGLLFLSLGAAAAEARRAPVVGRAHRQARLDPADVNDAGLTKPVRSGSPAKVVLRAQILLARAHFSCGEIDARYGEILKGAIAAYQESRGLPASGIVNAETWRVLNADTAAVLVRVRIEPEDVAGPFLPIPEDMMEKAKLPALNYSTPLEGIAEKYHASPALLTKLNLGSSFSRAGEEIVVPDVAVPPPGRAATVYVSKSKRCVTALDAAGMVLARYPSTSGSVRDPLPLGQWRILGVAHHPAFHYNPELFWNAKETHEKAHIPPGPNNPVGVAWIDLSKEHYGIHGTPEPSTIGKTSSHGCIRMTNWDVTELSRMVSPGTPAVLEE